MGIFILNNYKQALKIIKDFVPEHEAFKARLQVTDIDIENWVSLEKQFLKDLKDEPESRSLATSYAEALINRHIAQ